MAWRKGEKVLKTPQNLWILAKMHALSADSQTHEMVKHLGMGHMMGETFAISHNNTYYYKPTRKEVNGNKAIGKMLGTHFVNLIAINAFARVTLVDPLNATISFFQGIRGEDFVSVIAGWYSDEKHQQVWDYVGYYDELKKRGFDPLDPNQQCLFEHYRFMKDGKSIYDQIELYVRSVIFAQYSDDD